MTTRNAGLSTKFYGALLRIGFALAIAFLLTRLQFEYIEGLFYDARVRLTPTPPTSGLIQTVTVDPRTVEKLNRIPSAADHAQVLRFLKQAGARVVIFLFNPNELTGTDEARYELADIAQSFSSFYVGINDVALKGDTDAFRLVPPFNKLEVGYAPITADANIFARDNVTRRMMISYRGQPMMHLLVAQLFNNELKDERNVRGVFEFLSSNQAYIAFHPTGTYPTASFIDLAANVQPLERFKDKIVIIGRDTQATSKDYVLTPFSRELLAMSGVELNANALDTLLFNSAPVRAPNWVNLIFTSLISILTIYVVLSLKPTQGLFILASTIVGFFVLGFLFFWWGGVWIGMAHPFLAVFIVYYFFIPYRLIVENRRSWEYYQKNRLLTQVEELKTNFLSMMSHDLKTPIARIQGMTDIVLKDANPLSTRQKEALHTLSRSSEELLEFVSSILNLGRIESKELKLHMKSRDPNSLIEEVIEKYQYLAKTKSIEVTSELEPLFSVKMDVDLMRQVFSNLLENAIKYSPENSRILVTSEEQEGKIVIQFADQGQGIPEDELPHVFMKFYRSKNAKASPTKGSGLGLYLAKYFVELHKGSISVDSRLGEGSTFTVELPTTASED